MKVKKKTIYALSTTVGIGILKKLKLNGGSDSIDETSDSDDYCMEDVALYAVEGMGDVFDSDMNLVEVTDAEHDYESPAARNVRNNVTTLRLMKLTPSVRDEVITLWKMWLHQQRA